MAFRAMTGLTTEWFEPERFKVDEKNGELVELEGDFSNPTRIHIKPLSGADYLAAFSGGIPAATQIIVACRKGVIGWDNLQDEEGAPVEFKEKKISEVLPGEIMNIITKRIFDLSTFNREQEKN